MPPEQLQVNFRMPADLKARLEHAAQASGRTLTAEIVYRLQQSFPEEQAKVGGEWDRAFPSAAVAHRRKNDPSFFEARERLVYEGLRLQQLRLRADALQNQQFLVENQVMTVHDTLLRKMGELDKPGLIKGRRRQLEEEVDVLKERLKQIDERVLRLRAEEEAVRRDIAQIERAAFDISASLVDRGDGQLEIIGDRPAVEAALYTVGIPWQQLEESVLVRASDAGRVRALFSEYPRAIIAELERRQGANLDARSLGKPSDGQKPAARRKSTASATREFQLPGPLFVADPAGRLSASGAAPAMRVVTHDDGSLILFGNVQAIQRYLIANGITGLEETPDAVLVDAARGERVRTFLGLPSRKK